MLEITLNAEDISEIAELMNKEDTQLSQGYIEYLLCKAIRDYKDLDFFEESPIKGDEEDEEEDMDHLFRC